MVPVSHSTVILAQVPLKMYYRITLSDKGFKNYTMYYWDLRLVIYYNLFFMIRNAVGGAAWSAALVEFDVVITGPQ